jgi:hypothetical protein
MNVDVWDSIKFTADIQGKADELLKDSKLVVERRGETTYYPGKLFSSDDEGHLIERKVVVADNGQEHLTIIATQFVERRDAVLVLRVSEDKTRQIKGSIIGSRPGRRTDDRKEGKCMRFVASFKPNFTAGRS